jgi:M6 family metalloprotease-like protein
MVTVKVWGDEYYQVVETLDGYTLVRDGVTGIICYARLSADGNELESTGVRVGTVNPIALGLNQHIRINRDARDIKVKVMRDQAQVGMPGDLPAAAPPSTGNVLGICLLVDFSDQPASIPVSDVDDFCNDFFYTGYGNNGSVRTYYSDVSDEMLDYETWVMPDYYRAGQPFSWYDDCAETWLARGKQLIIEVLDSLDAEGMDFSQFDSNGDNYIDAINLFYAGNTTCGWAKGMWPGSGGIHDWWTSDEGIKTDRFQITGMGTQLRLSTYCHENGHMVGGWPDLYDYDGDSRGVGQYCLMSSAADGQNPIEPCAYLKYTAGWSSPTVYAANQLGINVGPSSNNDNVFKFVNPGNSKEYFLIENRLKTARDTHLPDDGLIIYHVDEDGDHNANEMTMLSHFLVTVVQADGQWDLEMDVNSGDTDDLYGDDYRALGPCTNPGSEWWDNSASNFNFNNISDKAPTMTFDFTLGNDPPVLAISNWGLDADEYCCIEVSASDIDIGSYDLQGPGDIASMLITEVDGEPVTPAETVEVCGAGMHTVEMTVTDLCGNSTSGTVGVDVMNEGPVVICKNFAADADTNCCIRVGIEDIDDGSYDPDGPTDVKSFGITAIDGNPISLADTVDVCGEGLHFLTLTMTDWCDSTSSCDTGVEVIDVTPPSIVVDLDRYDLWPPNHKLVEILASVEVEDNCDPDPDWILESITSNEPDNGKSDGNTEGDIVADIGTPDDDFMLRSERQGKEDGRIYTIIYKAWDASGNVARDTVRVEVPHDMGYHAMCAYGFGPGGFGFELGANDFAIVIPSSPAVYKVKGSREELVTPAVIAREIDVSRAYVGNTAGTVVPLSSRLLDVDGDNVKDLVLVYDIKDVTGIKAATDAITALEIAAGAIYDGPVGLHFRGQDGTPWLVSDIFALGEPITLPERRDVADIRREDPEPLLSGADTKVQYDNGIASIYPNPFNPRTTVKFTLAARTDVTVAVYDVRGALVRTLVQGTLGAGEHTAGWDGTDMHGQAVATGVYFTRMIAGSFEQTRKMVLVK